MGIEYFCAYHSYLQSIDLLDDAERGRLFTALLEYSSTGIVPKLRGNERFVFSGIRAQIDRDAKNYEEKCRKQSENAKKRWQTQESPPAGEPLPESEPSPPPMRYEVAHFPERLEAMEKKERPPFRPLPGSPGSMNQEEAFREILRRTGR